MKWFWKLILVLTAGLICGCGADDIVHLPEETTEELDQAAIDESAAENESAVAAGIEFEPPFPSNRDFFSPPGIEVAVASPETSSSDPDEPRHQRVRVIGFSQVADSETQALIEIGGRLETAGTGDSVGDVIVVRVDPPTVILQQQNERWTVSLFSQPRDRSLVADRGRGAAGFDRESASWMTETSETRSRLEFSESTQSDRDQNERSGSAAVGFSSLPPVPGGEEPNDSADFLMPDDLELPDPPQLPDFELEPDQPLPGIDSIPDLPTAGLP